jgi:hypothetical protein
MGRRLDSGLGRRCPTRTRIAKANPGANQCGYTVVGIDAAIEREAKKRKAAAASDASTITTRPGIHRP